MKRRITSNSVMDILNILMIATAIMFTLASILLICSKGVENKIHNNTIPIEVLENDSISNIFEIPDCDGHIVTMGLENQPWLAFICQKHGNITKLKQVNWDSKIKITNHVP